MFCGNCGNQVNEGQAYCPYCGEALLSGKKQKAGKGKNILIAFLVFMVIALAAVVGYLACYSFVREEGQETGRRVDDEESSEDESSAADSKLQMVDSQEDAAAEVAEAEEAENGETEETGTGFVCVKEVDVNTEEEIRTEIEYDTRGEKISEIIYGYDSSDNMYKQAVTEYDQGKEVKSTWYNEDGSVDFENESVYNQQGQLVKTTSLAEDGSLRWINEFEYDSMGNQSKVVIYDENHNVKSWMEYKYDEQGNKIEQNNYDEEGNLKDTYQYTYDANGNEIAAEYFMDSHQHHSKIIREYDAQGREIILMNYMGEELSVYNEFQYNAEGKLIRENSYKDIQKNLLHWTDYQYDQHGNCTKVLISDEQGTYKSYAPYENYDDYEEGKHIEYEYDSYGNMTKKNLVKDDDGTVVRWTEYEYKEV